MANLKRWLIVVTLFLGTFEAKAQVVPYSVSYHGYLTNVGGEPINAAVPMTFRLYSDPEGGTPLWEEIQPGIAVENGVFSVQLGLVNPLDETLFPWGEDRWLGIQVDIDDEMVPRQLLVSTPYSLRSSVSIYAEAAGDADTLGGVTAAELEESTEIDQDISAHASIPDAHHTRYADGECIAAVDGAGYVLGPHTTYTAGNQLSLNGNTFDVVEGFGSGLDADTVDGAHAAALEESAEIDADIATHAVLTNAHHSRQHSLSGGDHTGDLVYSQIDGIVDTSSGGSASMISAAGHTHSGSDGSSQVAHVGLSGVSANQHHAKSHGHTAGDGSGQLDWDTCWTDAVHSHASSAEGGSLDARYLRSDTSDSMSGTLSANEFKCGGGNCCYIRVQSNIAYGTVVTCNSGGTIVGGGGGCYGYAGGWRSFLVASYPSGNGWAVKCENTDNGDQQLSANTWAICCKIGP